MAATKRNFILPSGIGISADNIYVINTTNSSSTSTGSIVSFGGAGIAKSISIGGYLQLFNGANYTAFVSSASGNTVYILPASTPATGTSVLQSTSAGVMSWVPMVATGSGAASGFTNLNGITAGIQYFATGTSGNEFNISSSGSTHTFNIPIAGSGSTGLISTQTQTIAGQKTFTSAIIGNLTGTATTSGFASTSNYSNQSGYGITAGLATTATYSHQAGYAITSGSSGSATTANNLNVVNALTNSAHTLLFSLLATGSGVAVSSNTTLSYNPSSFVLSTSGLAITATTASTSTSNGALQVAGGVGISGRLSFNQAAFGTTGITNNPSMAMIGQTGDPIFMTILEDNSISFEGSQGQLFSITPNLSTGYIYSVNDITGIPLLRANANANVTANEYAGNFGIGLTNPGYKLHVLGSVGFTSTTASTSTTTGTLVVSGGVGIGGSLNVASATSISGVTINNGVVSGNLTGTATTAGFATTASTANSWTTPRTITLGGDLSGNVTWSGSGDTTLTATIAANSVALGTDTTGQYASTLAISGNGITATSAAADDGTAYTIYSSATSANVASSIVLRNVSGSFSAGTITASLSGTATTAQNINVANAITNSAHPILFSPSATGSGLATSSNTTLSYNPSTLVLSTSGIAITAGTASTNSTSGALVVSGGVGIGGSLFVAGDLTINGTTTTINTVTLTVDDKNIELGSVASPSDVTAEGGGITLKGTSDKYFNWYTGTGWSSSESLNLINGNTYKIANTTVLSNSSLGTGVTNSSLTALGTITTGTWAGTVITSFYGGTGLNSYSKGDLLVGAGNTLSKLPVGNDLTILTADSNAGSGLSWKGLLTPTYGSFGSTATQPVAGANTITYVNFDSVFYANKVSIGSGTSDRVYINDSGIFDVQFSSQLSLASGSQPQVIDMWFVVDGVPVPKSATRQTVNGKDFESVLTVNLVQPFISGQYIQLAYSSPDIHMQLGAFSNLTTPIRPDIPSIFLTVEPISSILPGSGLAITGLASLNLLTSNAQTLVTGTSGNDFNISSIGSVHTFNIPNASATNRGLITTGAQTLSGIKTFASEVVISDATVSTSTTTGALTITGGVGIGGSLYVNSATRISGVDINNGTVSGSLTGTATTATNINVVLASSNGNHPLLFTPTSGSASGVAVSSNSTLVYNAVTDILSVSGMAVTSGTASTSASTGALIVSGGVGIGGSLFAATSIAADSGVFGLSLQRLSSGSFGAIYSTGVAPTTNNYSLATDGTNLNLNSTSNVYLNISNTSKLIVSTNNVNIGINVASISQSTGSLTVTGGVGIGGSLYVGSASSLSGVSLNNGAIGATSTTNSTTASTGAVIITGGVGIGQSASIGGRLQLFNSGNYTAFVSSASGNTVYTLPATTPATGSSVLQSTAAGVMSWVPLTSTASSGSTSQNIVVNSAGNANVFHPMLFTPSSSSAGSALSSDSTISFNPSTEILNVSGLAITSGTASTNTTTGALVVRGGLGVTGQLSFATASFGFTGITTNPTMSFIGATSASPITLTVLTDNSLSWEGTSGQLFSIDNNLTTGDIFSVSDISGLPIINASAGQTVTINEFGGFTRIGNGSISASSSSTGSLVVSGGLGITGNAVIGGTFLSNNTTNSTSSNSGALVLSGGIGIGQSASIAGRLQLFNSSNYTAFVSSATGNTLYTLPATSPATGSSVLQSTSAGVMSWVSPSVLGIAVGGSLDGSVQYKTGSGLGGTRSFFFNTTSFGLRLGNFPGEESTTGNSAALLIEQSIGSFNGSVNGTLIAVNANSGFTGDLINLQVNANTKFRVSASGAIGFSSGINAGGDVVVSSPTAATNSTSGALQVAGGAGIARTLFVGGNTHITGTTYSGTNTFTKTLGLGDISLDNGTSDTPSVTFYWGNNRNIGIDTYWAGSGATRFRITKELNEVGGGELWSVDRNGIVTQTAWDVGEVINTRVYNNTDLNMSATTTINSTTYTNVATITYTPKSTTSHLWIEFDAHYDFSNGTTADDFFSRITVGGSAIVEKNQIMVGQVGGGTRSGTIFPISGRYTNTTTSGIAITVQAKWGSADDAIRVYGSTTSGYMRIQEIGR